MNALIHNSNPKLDDPDIHIWQIPIMFDDIKINKFMSLLSSDEKSRLKSFKTKKLKDEYCFARGRLREVLASYLKLAPEEIIFNYNTYGKPLLSSNLFFNLSHTKDMVVIAISKTYEIGVDIEYIDSSFEVREVLPVALTDTEIKFINSLNKYNKHKAFFKIWSRKEALFKGVGKGLFISPNLVDVCDDISTFEGWEIIDLNLGENYSSVVAIKSMGHAISLTIIK